MNEPGGGSELTFVVGTGRCGSTAVSTILNSHPAILSLNELLTSIGVQGIPDAELTGREFWQLIAAPNTVFDAMIRGDVGLPEFLYPRNPGRFSAEVTGIPAISLMVLPHLTADPDGLFDELSEVVARWPRRLTSQHYEALFQWLRSRFGRSVTVERSGYSLHWIPVLRRRFPQAKFVHLFRNGPDCAVSMSQHPGLRVILLRHRIMDSLGIRSLTELTPEDKASLPPELAGILADRFDASTVWQPIPLEDFGGLWSRLVQEGLDHLAKVPADSRMSLSYEALCSDLDGELRRLADFLGVSHSPSWLASARSMFDLNRQGASARLPAAELATLRQRCAPGTGALEEAMGREARS